MVTAQNLRSVFAATNFIRFFFVDFVAIGPERFTCHTDSGLGSEAQAAITLSARLQRTTRIRYPFRRWTATARKVPEHSSGTPMDWSGVLPKNIPFPSGC